MAVMPGPDAGRRALLSLAATIPLMAPAKGGQAAPDGTPGRIPGEILVTDYGAVGDGVADDHAAIMRAIAEARRQGGGTVILPHAGPWRITASIEIENDIVLTGVTQHTVVRMQGDAGSVIVGANKARFRIANLTLIGTRPPGSRPPGSRDGSSKLFSDGIALRGCSYFDIDSVRADYCRHGYRFRECFTFGVAQATALRCASYGFALSDACTSFVFRNTTAWGCGGGWSVAGCVYGSLIGCACDASDAGGKPGDPFGDSGGDYRHPSFVFDLAGSKGISIIAPGCENCNSPWLYGEGTQATILNPYIFGLEAHTSDWRLIQLRGSASYSNVTIVNPFGFDSVTNHVAAPTAIMIENPRRQRLYLSGRWRVGGFDGAQAYPAEGLIVEGLRPLLDYTQTSMVPGATRFLPAHPQDRAAVIAGSAGKVLRLEYGGGGTFKVTIPSEGLIQFKARARCSMPGGVTFGLQRRGSATLVKSWQPSATSVIIDEWFYLPPVEMDDAEFTIELKTGARIEFDTLVLNCIEAQI